jgi:hypothetical protein
MEDAMFVLAKFLHLFGLMLGAAAGIGNLLILAQLRKSSPPPAPQLLALRPAQAKLALTGIGLLWLTGLWMYSSAFSGAALSGAFHVKLAVAALLLALIILVNVIRVRSARSGAPPPA